MIPPVKTISLHPSKATPTPQVRVAKPAPPVPYTVRWPSQVHSCQFFSRSIFCMAARAVSFRRPRTTGVLPSMPYAAAAPHTRPVSIEKSPVTSAMSTGFSAMKLPNACSAAYESEVPSTAPKWYGVSAFPDRSRTHAPVPELPPCGTTYTPCCGSLVTWVEKLAAR